MCDAFQCFPALDIGGILRDIRGTPRRRAIRAYDSGQKAFCPESGDLGALSSQTPYSRTLGQMKEVARQAQHAQNVAVWVLGKVAEALFESTINAMLQE